MAKKKKKKSMNAVKKKKKIIKWGINFEESIIWGISKKKLKKERKKKKKERKKEKKKKVKVHFLVRLKCLHRFLSEIILLQQQYV